MHRAISKGVMDMKNNPLINLEKLGQSIWTDFISRRMIEGGGLQNFIANDGVTGVTSNPSIFEKAIANSHDYDSAIKELAKQGKTAEEIYEILTVEDIQRTADVLRSTYTLLDGKDGYVSLEVSPKLAHNTDGTIDEARRLWNKVHRPNVMIKVPGTEAGLPAIRQLIEDGMNVNITLLFGLPRYRQVVESYMSGLESRARRGEQLKDIASVASFFISRIDVLVDPLLEEQAGKAESDSAKPAVGQTAIASAKIAYRMYGELFTDKRFRTLADRGAKTQRLLWASTSTKNPKYSDIKYVEPLIGPETINTVPLETLEAYRDHGNPQLTLTNKLPEADVSLERLKQSGIDLEAVTRQLEKEGVEKFVKAYDLLMDAIRRKTSEIAPQGTA
jgi:transaldolase